jgi:hypothetical protein
MTFQNFYHQGMLLKMASCTSMRRLRRGGVVVWGMEAVRLVPRGEGKGGGRDAGEVGEWEGGRQWNASRCSTLTVLCFRDLSITC